MTQVQRGNNPSLYLHRFLVVFLFIMTSASLLSACGWRMRGAIDLPPAMARTHIQGVAPFSELGMQLRNTLTSAGAEVVSEAKQATASLVIYGNEMSRRVLALDTSGRASEYELNYVLRFKVLDAEGRELVHEQTVTATRDYRFNPDAIRAKSDEETRLRKDMLRLAVQQMFFRINATLKTSAAQGTPAY